VADPKQSIYGWRGAEPLLVHTAADRYALEQEVFARSWRSSQVVLDAVNRVFDGIADRETAARYTLKTLYAEPFDDPPGIRSDALGLTGVP
jgi:ATP-dependent exoDNAse (exonuclease V) beta subunit